MAATTCCSCLQFKGLSSLKSRQGNANISESLKNPNRRNPISDSSTLGCRTHCFLGTAVARNHLESSVDALILPQPSHIVPPNFLIDVQEKSHAVVVEYMPRLVVLADLDPATVKLGIAILGPILSAFSFLFILRIIMSWYPKLPVSKFPYVLAYAPTEPLLVPARKLIPPLGGVDVTPVVWFALLSFLNEILVGPQGLLVLLSQQV